MNRSAHHTPRFVCLSAPGAHGCCGAVWTEGSPTHTHQHQECQSVPGKRWLAPRFRSDRFEVQAQVIKVAETSNSSASISTVNINGLSPLPVAALQSESDRNLQPSPSEYFAFPFQGKQQQMCLFYVADECHVER